MSIIADLTQDTHSIALLTIPELYLFFGTQYSRIRCDNIRIGRIGCINRVEMTKTKYLNEYI